MFQSLLRCSSVRSCHEGLPLCHTCTIQNSPSAEKNTLGHCFVPQTCTPFDTQTCRSSSKRHKQTHTSAGERGTTGPDRRKPSNPPLQVDSNRTQRLWRTYITHPLVWKRVTPSRLEARDHEGQRIICRLAQRPVGLMMHLAAGLGGIGSGAFGSNKLELLTCLETAFLLS